MGDNMSIVKSFSVGDGDMFYVNHNSDNFTIIDCCMSEESRSNIIKELKSESKNKGIIRFISTHPDVDHILGLVYLNKEMNLLNFYCVKNEATKPDETEDFDEYCKLRDDSVKVFYLFKGCSRKWMNAKSEDRGSSGINILWPDINSEHYKEELEKAKEGESPNNISPVVKYNLEGGVTILWMGDLETDFMEKVKDDVSMETVNILFAPHHGRDSGKVPENWLVDMNPQIVIIGEAPSEDLNYYDGYNTITQNSAGDILLECVSGKTHIYVSNQDYSVDFLDDENMPDAYGKYIGTLKV
jgi:beta-lactamase superfamily II metal-dependent hydrolase